MYYYKENSFSNSYTFDNFVIGEEDNPVYIAVKNILENFNKTTHYNPLFIVGDSGMGKTHLLNAVAHELNKKMGKVNFLYTTLDMFYKDIIESFNVGNGEIDKLKEHFNSLDFLIIDDFHQILNKKQVQNVFFSIFNNLYSNGKKIIIASQQSIGELAKFNEGGSKDGVDHIDERIISRLMCGLSVDMQEYDSDMIVAILRRKTAELNLSDEILQFIAGNVNTANIMKIDSLINKLLAHSVIAKKEITLEIVKDMIIKMHLNKDSYTSISIGTIIKATAKFFSVNENSITGDSRRKEVALARHIAMYLAVKHTNLGQESIGQFFGGKNHSSVIYARNRIEKKLKNDENYKYYVKNIISSINKS